MKTKRSDIWLYLYWFILCVIIVGLFVFMVTHDFKDKEPQVSVEKIVPKPTLVRIEGQIILLTLTQVHQLKLLKKQSEQIETLSKAQQAIIRRLE